jgi:PHS family inorganic phosphate transporter-like MFS transporter
MNSHTQIAFYGLGLNSSKIFDAKILSALGLGSSTSTGTPQDVFNDLHDTTVCTLIVIASGLMPGYLASFLLIDSWGRKPIQLMGFTILSALFLIMGMAHRQT